MQRSSNEDAGLRTKSFRVIVRTSDLVNTPVQNHFVTQFRLRILDQHSIEPNSSAKSFRQFGLRILEQIQWILKQTAGQHHFVSQVGLRILDQNSSGSWNKLQCTIVSCHSSDFGSGSCHSSDFGSWIKTLVDLETNSCATLFRVTVRTSCLTQKSSAQLFRITVWTSDLVFSQIWLQILDQNSGGSWKTTPAHNVFVSQFGLRILKQLQCKIISCHSSDFGSGSKLQWILETASAKNHFVSQFGLRVLEKNSSSNSDRVTLRTSDLAKNQVRTKTVGS